MKIILLKSVPKVGSKGDIVEVASGYAQHALFPKKFAIPATDAAVAALGREKESIASEKKVRHTLLDKAITTLNEQHLTMKVRANEQGNLFSKIHAGDIADFLMEAHRIAIDAELLELPDGYLKKLGTYTIKVTDEGYQATFTLDLVQ